MDVPYHLGEANSHSLAFVARDADALDQFLTARDLTDPRTESLTTPDGSELTLVYTTSELDANPTTDWLDTCSSSTATLVYTLLNTYAGVTDAAHLQQNKAFDLDKLPRAFERLDWRQSVPEVAGALFSNLVLAHALPNANHRSSLALTSLYLEAQDDRATLAADCTSSVLADVVDQFFIDSKRLLTVRRNTRQFQMLREADISTVTRKGNVTIHLDEYELDTDDPYSHFAAEHRRRSVEFVERYLRLQNLHSVVEATDKGKHAFVQSLQRS